MRAHPQIKMIIWEERKIEVKTLLASTSSERD